MKNIINPLDFGSKIEYASKLTKREYFAGLAMQGMLANKDASDFDALTTAQIAINYAETLLDELGEL